MSKIQSEIKPEKVLVKSNIPVVPTIHQLLQESSISAATKCDDISTPTATAYDNSFTSDPSEATNTISDDATIISQIENTIEKATEIKPASESTEVVILEEPPNEESASKEPRISVDAISVYQIIDSIRQTTSLSHKLSCVALRVVLSELESIYSIQILDLLEPIASHLLRPLSAPDEFVEHTHDSQRLKIIFSQLADCKNDSEQRTWILHEDEQYIKKFLTELIEILVNITFIVLHFNNLFITTEKCR